MHSETKMRQICGPAGVRRLVYRCLATYTMTEWPYCIEYYTFFALYSRYENEFCILFSVSVKELFAFYAV